ITNQYEFDDETCAQARQKLYDLARTTDPRPFALCVSFTHPHDPYATRRKYWDLYADDSIDLPAVPAPAYEQRDPHSQRLHHISDMGRFEISDEEIRNARRAYYGNVSYIDDCFGQLLDVLRATGLDKNTLILFTSDHGDMLGEHGLWYKMTFREWACRVPLMVYAPGRYAAHRVTQPVSHVDILPTLLDLAGGMEPVEPVAGHSLQGLLEGGQEAREVIGEYTGEGCIAPLLMIRREQYKYVYCEVDPPQLFDLASDPLECDNLAAKPEYQALAAAFQTEVLQRWDPVALRQQVLQDQKRRRFLAHTLSQGAYQSWDFQPQQDASQRYMRNHLDLNELEFNSRFPRARLFS
ncbi:MAG: choline-sulfatase, partial [Candidatus Competibacteraceae bacterium]|nr:choline-sulfatase [Candidatus Competibacteraceae bacterium]